MSSNKKVTTVTSLKSTEKLLNNPAKLLYEYLEKHTKNK